MSQRERDGRCDTSRRVPRAAVRTPMSAARQAAALLAELLGAGSAAAAGAGEGPVLLAYRGCTGGQWEQPLLSGWVSQGQTSAPGRTCACAAGGHGLHVGEGPATLCQIKTEGGM